MTVKRDENGRFLPGNSGGGRPKIPDEVRDATRAACPEAVQFLIGVMRNEKEKTALRIEAAKTILDRGYGKPDVMSKIEFTGEKAPVIAFRWIPEENTSTTTG